jgi:2TM domain
MSTVQAPSGDQLREQVIKQLKKRHDFHIHLLVYVLVNGFLAVIWAVTSGHGFFWPVFPMAGWGIGLVLHAWDTYTRQEPREEQVRHEMDRITQRR